MTYRCMNNRAKTVTQDPTIQLPFCSLVTSCMSAVTLTPDKNLLQNNRWNQPLTLLSDDLMHECCNSDTCIKMYKQQPEPSCRPNQLPSTLLSDNLRAVAMASLRLNQAQLHEYYHCHNAHHQTDQCKPNACTHPQVTTF